MVLVYPGAGSTWQRVWPCKRTTLCSRSGHHIWHKTQQTPATHAAQHAGEVKKSSSMQGCTACMLAWQWQSSHACMLLQRRRAVIGLSCSAALPTLLRALMRLCRRQGVLLGSAPAPVGALLIPPVLLHCYVRCADTPAALWSWPRILAAYEAIHRGPANSANN